MLTKVVDEIALDEGLDAEDDDVVDPRNVALSCGPRAVDGGRSRRVLQAVIDLVEIREKRWRKVHVKVLASGTSSRRHDFPRFIRRQR